MIDVFLKDGRTVFRLPGRQIMVALLQVDPFALSEDSLEVRAWALWQRSEDPDDWRPTKLLFLDRGAIAFVREVDHDDAELFAERVGLVAA